MLANLKAQLEAFNGVKLTTGEFTKVLHHLNKSAGVFNKANTLRDRMKLEKEDGETVYLEFFDSRRSAAQPLPGDAAGKDGGQLQEPLRRDHSRQRSAAGADRAEAAGAGDEGGLQPDPALPETHLLERPRAVPLRAALRDQQRGEHEVLRQRTEAVLQADLLLGAGGQHDDPRADALCRCLPEPGAPRHDDRQIHRAQRDGQDPDGAASVSILRHRGHRRAGEEPTSGATPTATSGTPRDRARR